MDISDGKAFDLVTLPVSQMGMAVAPFDKPHPVLRIQPLQITASGTLPETSPRCQHSRRWTGLRSVNLSFPWTRCST